MGRGRVVAVGGEEGDGFALGGLGECQPVRLFFFHRQAGFFFGVVVVLVGCKVEREIVLFFLPSFLLYFFSTLTFWLSQERPSKIPRGVSSVLLLFKGILPSPLVAQLGSTFHTWSLAILSRSRAWATSFGRIAVRNGQLAPCSPLREIWTRLTTVNILLVGKDEQDNVAHFAVLDNAAEFGFGFFHARAVAGVDDEDEGVGSWDHVSFRCLWFACV
jgi:hypothetical protein